MKKIFTLRSVWVLLTAFFIVWSVVIAIGGLIASDNANSINGYLGINPYKRISKENGETIINAETDFMDYVGGFDDDSQREYAMEVSTQAVAEGSVVLWNDGALPVKTSDELNFFGITSQNWLYSGVGSGQMEVKNAANLKTAFEDLDYSVNGTLWKYYRNLPEGQYGIFYNSVSWSAGTMDHKFHNFIVNEVPFSSISSDAIASVEGGVGIMAISRNSGEAGDLNWLRSYAGDYTNSVKYADNDYLDLTEEEAGMLKGICDLKAQGKLDSVVLLLNTTNPMSLKHIVTYDIDACVYVGIGGRASCEGVAAALSGKISPSGRLTDTFVYDSYSAPSSVNFGHSTFTELSGDVPAYSPYSHNDKYVVYQEGIYVGYRYYETRYEDCILGNPSASTSVGVTAGNGNWKYSDEVAYPFGWGETYADFVYENYEVKPVDDGWEVTLDVRNNGNVTGNSNSGKEVVQIYIQKPYTDYDVRFGIEKASVELAGFAKTKLLDPGEHEKVSVFIPEESFKTYDSYGKKTYILEAGDYYIATGFNAHDALNNILAEKGKSGMYDVNGDAVSGNKALCEKINVAADDYEKYSYSANTEITNRFDNADINLYEGTSDQKIEYITRDNWERSYPKAPVSLKCTNSVFVRDMQYGGVVEKTNDEVPSPVYGADNGYNLAMMINMDYENEEWEKLLDQMTWREQNEMVTSGYLNICGSSTVGAPGGKSKDGPQGIMAATSLDNYMAYPNEVLLAQTFNNKLVYEVGRSFGMDCMHAGITGLYGPGVNIHRSPLGGRNWEYYSEDPYISGEMFASEVKGLIEMGVIVFAKHFALNEQEDARCGVSTWANEQTIREIYLKPFETGVVKGKANGLMSSLNRVGAVWAGAHKGLMTDVLRGEWGFVGIMETDAGAGPHMQSAEAYAAGILAGNDYWMPTTNPEAFKPYENNNYVRLAVREACKRILYTQLHSNAMNGVSVTDVFVKVMPWWQIFIISIQVLFAVCALGCTVMSVLGFVLKKRADKLKKQEFDCSQSM